MHCDFNINSAPFISELRLWELNLEIWTEKSRSRTWQYHYFLILKNYNIIRYDQHSSWKYPSPTVLQHPPEAGPEARICPGPCECPCGWASGCGHSHWQPGVQQTGQHGHGKRVDGFAGKVREDGPSLVWIWGKCHTHWKSDVSSQFDRIQALMWIYKAESIKQTGSSSKIRVKGEVL